MQPHDNKFENQKNIHDFSANYKFKKLTQQ